MLRLYITAIIPTNIKKQQSTTCLTIPDFLRDFSDLNPKNGEIGRSCVELHLKIVCMKIFVIISTIFVKTAPIG